MPMRSLSVLMPNLLVDSLWAIFMSTCELAALLETFVNLVAASTFERIDVTDKLFDSKEKLQQLNHTDFSHSRFSAPNLTQPQHI